MNIVWDQKAGGVLFRMEGEKAHFIIIYRKNLKDWVLPKGHIENGETPEKCALREVEEETGWKAKIIDFVDIQSYEWVDRENDVLHKVNVSFFLMEPLSQDKSLIDKKETEEIRWV